MKANMSSFTVFLYTTLFPVVLGIAKLISSWNPKVRTFFSVRKTLFEELELTIDQQSSSSSTFRLWVHASSVGEFEQARPVIATMKERHPELTLFVSFLSDSGYNARKNYPDATAVFYLPADTRHNAKKLVALLKPDVLLLMRYDFWPNHLVEAKKAGVKLILAAAVLQKHAPYFNPALKGFYQNIFHLFNQIFTASPKDTLAFREKFRCEYAETAGDPRFDQVWQRSRNSDGVDHIRSLYHKRMVLVAGSVWEQDEMLLLSAWQALGKGLSLVLVPHQVNPENMARLYRELDSRSLAYTPVSAMNGSFNPEKQILVIDQTGYLVELYSVASIAYVGGGFGVNVHNTLEAAVYHIPVLFGPRYHNSPDAEGLVAAGGATVIHDQKELATALGTLIHDTQQRENIGKSAGKFVEQNIGATAIIVEGIESFFNQEANATRAGKSICPPRLHKYQRLKCP